MTAPPFEIANLLCFYCLLENGEVVRMQQDALRLFIYCPICLGGFTNQLFAAVTGISI